MAIIPTLKSHLLQNESIKHFLNKRWSQSRQPLAITSTLLTTIRPLFCISGPSTCKGVQLANIQTLLNLAQPDTTVPFSTDTIDILPTSLTNYTFKVFRELHSHTLFSTKAQDFISYCAQYKGDLIYCDLSQPSAYIEHLIRTTSPRIVISIGESLPPELTTIQLPRDVELTTIFPFLVKNL